MAKKIALILFIFMVVTGCNGNQSETNQTTLSQGVFSRAVTLFGIAVYYETGATPRVGTLGIGGNDVWSITQVSFAEVFSTFSSRTVEVPTELAQMTEISDQSKSTWSNTELETLGHQVHPSWQDGTTRTLGIIFLNGKFNGSDSVLGVHLTGSPFAFVFKDIVESVGGTETQQEYVEQAVVVHELGHTVGLVNNGIPMQQHHEDSEHPGHTTNSDGVMYWAVESTSGVLDFVSDVLGTSSRQLFGSESLADCQNYQSD